MGFLRSFGKAFFFILFTTFLMLFLVVNNLVDIMSYDSLKPLFSKIASGFIPKEVQDVQISQEQLDQARALLDGLCKESSTGTINVTDLARQFGLGVGNLPPELSSIDCSELDRVIPSDASAINTAEIVSSTFFDSIYYREYKCEFLECLLEIQSDQDIMIFMSAKFHSFLVEAKDYILVFTIATLAVFVLLTETLAGRLKGVGWGMLSVGIVPLIFQPINNVVIAGMRLPAEIQSVMAEFVNPVLNSMFANFYIVLAIGIALLAVGYTISFVAKRRVSETALRSTRKPAKTKKKS